MNLDEEFRKLDARLSMIEFNIDYLMKHSITVSNDHNGLDIRLQALEARLAAFEDRIDRESRQEWLQSRAQATARAVTLAGGGDRFAGTPDARAPGACDLDAQLAQLRARAPANFESWLEAFEIGRRAYDRRLPSDLSTSDHRIAHHFRAFVAVHGRGTLLDIGCGPLAKPLYLEDFPDRVIAGIDPLAGFSNHPFAFARSVAEFLPWPEASFDTVVCATSIDHVYLLDVALDEIRRVLTPGGRLLRWTSIFAETAPYDPYSRRIEPLDQFHLFHPGENWFPQLMAERFRSIERFDCESIGYANAFLAYERA